MPSKKEKKVEYKDTFDFKLFPQYKYSFLQTKRCLFFQGRIEHFKKAINFADKFDAPNRINIVYIIGYSPQLHKYVLGTKSNLVVLCAEVPTYALEAYDAYWKMIDSFKNFGYANEDGSLSDRYFKDRDAFYRYYGEDNLENDKIRKLKEEQQIIERYKAAVPVILRCFKKYKIIDKVHAPRWVTHEGLGKIIKRYFPLGREQCGIADNVCRSIVKVKQAAEMGLKHDDECVKKLLGTSSAEEKEILRRNIKRFDMNLNTAMRENGFVRLKEAYEEMKQPPYGWGDDPCTAYCFAYVMASHMQDHWIYDGINAFDVEEFGTQLTEVFVRGIKTWADYILFNTNGQRLSKRFAFMFNMEPIFPFAAMIPPLCKSIEKHTRIPVSVIDDKLAEIFRECEYLYNIPKMNEAIKHFDWDKCKAIRDRYATINEDVLNELRVKYGDNAESMLDVCTTECSGWLWNSKLFYDTLRSVHQQRTQD